MKRTLVALFLSLGVVAGPLAQPAVDPDDAIKEDIVTAYKILVNEGILDSFGHVSARSAKNPNVFLMPQAMPPALVTKADILELNVADSQPIDPKGRRVNGERYIHGEVYKARPDVQSVIHSHSQAVIPLSLTPFKMKPVVAQAGFLPLETPNYEIRDAKEPNGRGLQVTDSRRGAALAKTLGTYPAVLMRGHGETIAANSIKRSVVYAAYVDINARMQTQAMAISQQIKSLDESELFTEEEFDINRPWEHLRQKILDVATKGSVDRSQFGLSQTQEKR